MRQRTFGGFERHQEFFEEIRREVLEEESDGLLAHELRARVLDHSRFNINLGPKEFSAWLDQASHDVVVNDSLNPCTDRIASADECGDDMDRSTSKALGALAVAAGDILTPFG